MEIDPSKSQFLIKKSNALKTLKSGPISSNTIPPQKEFQFYYNYNEFRAPIDQIGEKSQSMLRQISSSKQLLGGKVVTFPQDVEDDSCELLMNVNDEFIERFDNYMDEFSQSRDGIDDNGFQLVCGRKKKGGRGVMKEKEGNVDNLSAIRVVGSDKKTVGGKSMVPFHIPTIRKPQEEFNIIVNNSNEPFRHVWLELSEDGSRFIHPLENMSVLDFVDCNVESVKPVEPTPYGCTPFKVVEDVKDLKEMAAKLRNVDEFAIDLEHNQYRSFQGLTCLMQISTRTEDFAVDTLKLRIHIGPYLRDIFKDPTKKKVMHGANGDIVWLQRDFGIYVCNLFDTGQASRVLQLERNSLEYLLQHFCGVAANKEYQNADWRLRPIPCDMLRYAREDTHYLLYIYDLLRIRLLSECTDPENSNALLVEVYKRSYDLCIQLYEKELFTDTSYLHKHGIPRANLDAKQLSVLAGLFEWRDAVARQEDESTGYILPNKLLLEIAKQMPVTTSDLMWLLKSKHPYVEHNLISVVNVIWHSVQNASCFEVVAKKLKEGHMQVPQLNPTEGGFPELPMADDDISESHNGSQSEQVSPGQSGSCNFTGLDGEVSKVFESTVQVMRKPGSAFGALLGSSASKKNTSLNKGEFKLEQIKSSVNLPSGTCLTRERPIEALHSEVLPNVPVWSTNLVDAIDLTKTKDRVASKPELMVLDNEDDDDKKLMSLSDLASSFEKCLQSVRQDQGSKQGNKSEETAVSRFKPFDYEAARKQIQFGGNTKNKSNTGDSDGNLGKKKSVGGGRNKQDEVLPQGKRRQAFPASGNRSSLFSMTGV